LIKLFERYNFGKLFKFSNSSGIGPVIWLNWKKIWLKFSNWPVVRGIEPISKLFERYNLHNLVKFLNSAKILPSNLFELRPRICKFINWPDVDRIEPTREFLKRDNVMKKTETTKVFKCCYFCRDDSSETHSC